MLDSLKTYWSLSIISPQNCSSDRSNKFQKNSEARYDSYFVHKVLGNPVLQQFKIQALKTSPLKVQAIS